MRVGNLRKPDQAIVNLKGDETLKVLIHHPDLSLSIPVIQLYYEK
jgi:hypothetical protein